MNEMNSQSQSSQLQEAPLSLTNCAMLAVIVFCNCYMPKTQPRSLLLNKKTTLTQLYTKIIFYILIQI